MTNIAKLQWKWAAGSITVVIIVATVIAFLIVKVYPKEREKEQKPLIDLIQDRHELVIKRIDSTDKLIQYKLEAIAQMDAEIKALVMKKKQLITNNYYQNETEILTSSDSANRAARIRNQSEFSDRYLKGYYRPNKPD